MFELMDAYSQNAVIKVIGVGGGGGNAVAHMVTSGIEGVEFLCINTDAQALKHSKVKTSLQIGCNITKGLGAGADPEVGRQAAMEDRDRIIELTPRHLGAEPLLPPAAAVAAAEAAATPPELKLSEALERFKRELIEQRLRRYDGKLSPAAASLGVDKGNFHRLVKRLGLR